MTRVTVRALRRLGIASRKLHLLDDPDPRESGHVVVEFRSNGRWLVVSPSDSAFVWRRGDGDIATLEDIRADSTVFAQIYRRAPGFPYRFDRTRNIRWEKLPRSIRGAFRLALGREGYERAQTPALYDDPRRLLFYMAGAASLLLAATALRLGRPRHRVSSAG
jgi:hypothetical protein